MQLTTEQLKQAYEAVTKQHREVLGEIVRRKGDKEDYQRLYNAVKGYVKL